MKSAMLISLAAVVAVAGSAGATIIRVDLNGGGETADTLRYCTFADPLFCDLSIDDVTVEYDSPCLPPSNPWGEQVGAWGWGRGSRIWYVLPDGTGDAPTIQAAIDSCGVDETVVVGPGVFRGVGNRDIDFHGKSISVSSQSGPDSTTVDCELAARDSTSTPVRIHSPSSADSQSRTQWRTQAAGF